MKTMMITSNKETIARYFWKNCCKGYIVSTTEDKGISNSDVTKTL